MELATDIKIIYKILILRKIKESKGKNIFMEGWPGKKNPLR